MKTACPECGHSIQVKEADIGKVSQCVRCNRPFRIIDPNAPAVLPAPPESMPMDNWKPSPPPKPYPAATSHQAGWIIFLLFLLLFTQMWSCMGLYVIGDKIAAPREFRLRD